MKHLFLFDIDGVLISPRGYLLAIQDTVSSFSHQFGVGKHCPTEAEIRTFETFGITSDWDITPICIAAILIARLKQTPELLDSDVWSEALKILIKHPSNIDKVDYELLAERIGAKINVGIARGQTAISVLREDVLSFSEPQRTNVNNLIHSLLAYTHDFNNSRITQYMQHLLLGSDNIKMVYGKNPEFTSPSYLYKYDTPLLNSAELENLFLAVRKNRVQASIYSLRRSLPPRLVHSTFGYPPEAEISLSLLGFDAFPLISYGRLHWLANQTNQYVGQLIKPSPVQALAAIGAAQSQSEIEALDAALVLFSSGRLSPPLTNLTGVKIHVFEDSLSGLTAVAQAVKMLRETGQRVTWYPYAIKAVGNPKSNLATVKGITLYNSVNEALYVALSRIN